MPPTHRKAFTLIEILIVVVIMAVLAAVIIPQFSSSTRDASESTLRFNLHTLRSQIALYRAHHFGQFPPGEDDTIPNLLRATDRHGDPEAAETPFGPYMDQIPANPFDGGGDVIVHIVEDIEPGVRPGGTVGDARGWQYNPGNGAVWPNNPEFYEDEEDE